MTGSLEGLVALPPRTATPGPAQAGTPAKTGSGTRAASKRKLAASAAGSTAPGALLRSVLVDGGPDGACLAWPTSHAVRHPLRLKATVSLDYLTSGLRAMSLYLCRSWIMS